MKYAVLAAAVSALAMAPAFAQDQMPPAEAAQAAETPAATFVTQCPALPADPEIPDGATARSDQVMARGDAAVQAWSGSYLEVMNCRVAEVNALEGQLRDLLSQFRQIEALRDSAKAGYDRDADAYRATAARWEGEVAEYNNRGAAPDNRTAR